MLSRWMKNAVFFNQRTFKFIFIFSYVLLLLDILKYHLSDLLFQAETIDYLLFNCPYSNMFWFDIYNWLSLKKRLTLMSFILWMQMFLILLWLSWIKTTCKWTDRTPSFSVFMHGLVDYFKSMKCIIKNNKNAERTVYFYILILALLIDFLGPWCRSFIHSSSLFSLYLFSFVNIFSLKLWRYFFYLLLVFDSFVNHLRLCCSPTFIWFSILFCTFDLQWIKTKSQFSNYILCVRPYHMAISSR